MRGARDDRPSAARSDCRLDPARERRGRLRDRADGHRGLPDLARSRAAADPLADRRDRRRPVLRPRTAAGPLRRAPRLARHGPALAGPDQIPLLRADRAAGAWAAGPLQVRRPARPHGRRRRRAAEPLRARGRAARRRARRRRRERRGRGRDPARGCGDPRARPRRRRPRRPARRGCDRPSRRAASGRGRRGAHGRPRRAPSRRAELVVYGRTEETLARVRAADRRLAALARRDALAAGLAEALSILAWAPRSQPCSPCPSPRTRPASSTACSSPRSRSWRSRRSTRSPRCRRPRASCSPRSPPDAGSPT